MLVPITGVADWRHSDDDFLAAFRLPQKGAGTLAARYPFPREGRIAFDEGKHEYTIDGIKAPRSVTGLLHEYAPEFNPQQALNAMKNGRDWDIKRAAMEEQSLGTSDQEILQRWQRNGEIARSRGHLLHYQMEQCVNGRPLQEPHSPEFSQAKGMYEHLLSTGLVPYRAEVNVSGP